MLRVSWRQVRAWLATVRSLAHIRHENVLLYMGAAVDPPRFAIVTCPVKVTHLAGDITLAIILPGTITGVCSQPRPRTQPQHQGDPSYHHIIRTIYCQVSILTQTALALSYLHAKEIVHGRLSAHNIFLETKVPLCRSQLATVAV